MSVMSLRRNRISLFTAALLCVAAPGIAQAPLAAAAPNSPAAAGWSFRVSSVPAGVGSGGELAFDDSRRSLFITDDDFVMSTKGGSDVSFDPHVVKPKVTVFSTATRRPVRSIDFTPQPWGMMPVGNAPIIPTLQVPDGISLDTKRGKLVVSNSTMTVAKFEVAVRAFKDAKCTIDCKAVTCPDAPTKLCQPMSGGKGSCSQ